MKPKLIDSYAIKDPLLAAAQMGTSGGGTAGLEELDTNKPLFVP